MKTTRFEDRLRQLEARVITRAETRKLAEIDESDEHGRRVANIFRHNQDRRQPMTLTEAERLATEIEAFLAAVARLHGVTDDTAPV